MCLVCFFVYFFHYCTLQRMYSRAYTQGRSRYRLGNSDVISGFLPVFSFFIRGFYPMRLTMNSDRVFHAHAGDWAFCSRLATGSLCSLALPDELQTAISLEPLHSLSDEKTSFFSTKALGAGVCSSFNFERRTNVH